MVMYGANEKQFLFLFRAFNPYAIFMDAHQTPAWNETETSCDGKRVCSRQQKENIEWSFLACAWRFDCVSAF